MEGTELSYGRVARASRQDALVGDLPAYRGLRQGGYTSRMAADDLRHRGKGGANVARFGPDRDLFHGIGIGDLSLLETIGDGGRGEVVDGIDHPVAVAEPRRIPFSNIGYGVSADVNGHLYRLIEELRFDEGVHLGRLLAVAGLVGKADVGEQAVRVVEEMFIEALNEILSGGRRFRMAARSREEKSADESVFQQGRWSHGSPVLLVHLVDEMRAASGWQFVNERAGL